MSDKIFLGSTSANKEKVNLLLPMSNRHGLIAGATGTGKTITLQGLAESFSAEGVSVFMADVKGDLAGLAMPGHASLKLHKPFSERAQAIGYEDYQYSERPVVFWDLFGEQGHPVRTTVSEMGPLLLSRLLELNETQEGVLNIVFKVADDEGLLLLNFDDLRSTLHFCIENSKEISTQYGHFSKASIGTIQRQVLALESQGGDKFFGEPALEIDDLIATDKDAKGVINILSADKLMSHPRLYSSFLLWMLSELFESLPEAGDQEKPKLVFFFDEAHLLFDEAPKALLEKIELVVRLIRSKGVGVYFVSQSPMDIPDDVSSQLGHRLQHALRAYSPKEKKAIKVVADCFRENPKINVEQSITELKVGEALVSVLNEDGAPTPVERVLIKPPVTRAGTLTAKERLVIQSMSDYSEKYDEEVDRESAFEVLQKKAEDAARVTEEVESEGIEKVRKKSRKTKSIWQKAGKAAAGAAAASAGTLIARQLLGKKSRASPGKAAATSVAGTLGTELGKAIGFPGLGRFTRGLLGGLIR